MRKFSLIGSVLVALVLVPAVTAASPPGRVIGHASASGQVAVTGVSSTAKHPRALYGRAIGHIDSAMFVVGCSHGFSIASNSITRRRAGTFRLPMMRNADSCDVIASVSGSGRIRIEIRAVQR